MSSLRYEAYELCCGDAYVPRRIGGDRRRDNDVDVAGGILAATGYDNATPVLA